LVIPFGQVARVDKIDDNGSGNPVEQVKFFF
jgi:hypothetical protein